MGCDFIPILLFAAALNGLGPEDGIREKQVMMIGQRYAAAYRLCTISSFPAFNSPNAGLGQDHTENQCPIQDSDALFSQI